MLRPGVRVAGVVGAAVARERDVRLKQCRHGLFLYPAREAVGQALDAFGEWDEQCVALYDLLLPAGGGHTVLDVGAHIGTYAVYFARRVGAGGRVVAVEPQRLVFQLLNANVALNGLSNVWAVHAACATHAEDGTAVALGHYEAIEPGMFSLRDFRFRTGRLSRFNESVRVRSVDGIVRELGLPRVELVKADVEGLEADVLRGANATIAAHRPLLYLEHNGHGGAGPLAETALVRLVRSWRYRVAAHQFFTRLSREQGGAYVESNILCVPEERAAEPRIAAALQWLERQATAHLAERAALES